MHLSRTAAILLRQYYLLRGSMARVLPLFVWVAVDIVLWGFITRYLNEVSGTGMNFVPTLLGAVLFWDFSIRVMLGVTMAFFEDVWSRNFLNMFATQLTISEYVLGLVLSSMATSSVGLLAMLVLSTTIFGLDFAVYGAMLLPFLLVLFLFGIALGVFACSLVLRHGPAAEWFVWPIPALLSPFCAVFYPLSVLPGWMQLVGHALPPAYVFEGMRAVVHGEPWPGSALAIGAVLAVLYVMIACWIFTRTYRHAVRTGLIARYSAETVS
jgi:ABC-2 type transport system permease protein